MFKVLFGMFQMFEIKHLGSFYRLVSRQEKISRDLKNVKLLFGLLKWPMS